MSNKLKSIAATVAMIGTLTMTPVGSAVAVWCQADAPMVYANMIGNFMPFITGLLSKTGLSTEGAIINAGAATRAEIVKAAMVNKTVAEGLEASRQEQLLKEAAVTLQQAALAPPTTCQSVATSEGLNKAGQAAQVSVMKTQAAAMRRVTSNTDTVASIEAAHKLSNDKFCSPEEAALRICTSGAGALAGADQEALFLFQGKGGSSSYEGAVAANGSSAQADAADAYISRIVGAVPPEHLRDRGEDYYKKNPQARAYVELLRRYNAMTSMGSYSLAQIKESHRTTPGLGTSTMMANAPGYEAKNDMSMAEVVERFVATKFSPTSVQSLSNSTEPHMVLRDLTQMQSFQLWLSYQAMLQSSRTEGLMAHQLALVAEQTLKPQIEAQRQAAARAVQK